MFFFVRKKSMLTTVERKSKEKLRKPLNVQKRSFKIKQILKKQTKKKTFSLEIAKGNKTSKVRKICQFNNFL